MDFAIQFLISLFAILALAGLAAWLSLGKAPSLRDDDHARELANEAAFGFTPVDIFMDRSRQAAVLRDDKDRVMLLRRHGAHFAARWLGPKTKISRTGDTLQITADERTFGTVDLTFDDAVPDWLAQWGEEPVHHA